MTHCIWKNYGLSIEKKTCIDQLKDEYVKGDRMKYIWPKFFFTHNLQKNGGIDMQQIHSSANLINLFTKILPIVIFENFVRKIGMCRFKDLKWRLQ